MKLPPNAPVPAAKSLQPHGLLEAPSPKTSPEALASRSVSRTPKPMSQGGHAKHEQPRPFYAFLKVTSSTAAFSSNMYSSRAIPSVDVCLELGRHI